MRRIVFFIFGFVIVIVLVYILFFRGGEEITDENINRVLEPTAFGEIGDIVDTVEFGRDQELLPAFEFDHRFLNQDEDFEEQRLIRLFGGTTAGYGVFNDGEKTYINLIQGGDGDRYNIELAPYRLVKVSDGNLLRVKEAFLFKNGKALVGFEDQVNESLVRYGFIDFNNPNSTIEPFDVNIKVDTNNINRFFYLKTSENGSIGYVVDLNVGIDVKEIWKNDLKNWNFNWGNNNRITIQTPTSSSAQGYSYLIDPSGDSVEQRLYSDVSSLGILYDEITNTALVHGDFEIKGRRRLNQTKIISRNLENDWLINFTIPEKCDVIFGIFICGVPSSYPETTRSGYETVFPDSWYLGDVSFEDHIVIYDSETQITYPLLRADSDEIKNIADFLSFDIVNPTITPDGNFFIFENKNDGSLWSYRL